MNQEARKVLQDYPQAVLALRSGFRDGRLGLMLGAGLTRGFQFKDGSPPSWMELIKAIEGDLKLDASAPAYQRLSATQRVDILYRHFLTTSGVDVTDRDSLAAAAGQWRDKIRQHLYKSAPVGRELLDSHPYLTEVLDLVLMSPLTVTYNFDSFLEEALMSYPPARAGLRTDLYQRPYETVTDVSVPQRRSKSVIYHINGYLPRNSLEAASTHLVFSEGEFSAQLVMTMAGRYATIAHHLVNNVYLLIGLSLDDPNLRQLLHVNALASPGRIHFVVRHVREARSRAELGETEKRISESGFDLHNLYSLYLTSSEIAALCQLIAMRDHEFSTLAAESGVAPKQVFYLSGIPGIGKTTVLRQLGGLQALDEWVEEAHPLLQSPHDALSAEERDELDQWIVRQFRLKNEVIERYPEGIFIVERGPLDPLAFEDKERIRDKARGYARSLDHGRHPLQSGHVLLLHGDTTVVERRIAGRQSRTQPAAYLSALQAQMRDIYNPSRAGVSDMRSTDWSIEELVKTVANRVYDPTFTPFDLAQRLVDLANG